MFGFLSSEYIRYVILVIIFGLVLLFFGSVSVYFGHLDIALSILLVGGVWGIDTFIKYVKLGDNFTAFADLSLTALVYTGGNGITIITQTLIYGVELELNGNAIINIILLSAFLATIWYANLSVLSRIADPDTNLSENETSALEIASRCIGILSCIMIVVFQGLDLI